VEGSFKWNKIKDSCKKFYFFGSDNDQYDCGISQAKIFQQYLGGELVFLPGEKHFNIESNPKYTEFPLVLEKILD
jgi:predicted alpha/beta hydrolase family esterase